MGDPQIIRDYKPLPSKLRTEVMRRDDYTCQHCLAASRPPRPIPLHVHHIKAYREGGGHVPENLITLCRKCHSDVERDRAQRIKQEQVEAKGHVYGWEHTFIRLPAKLKARLRQEAAEQGRVPSLIVAELLEAHYQKADAF